MQLIAGVMIKTEENMRGNADRRFRVIREIWSYRDADGFEYRKAFEYKPERRPDIPTHGTHEQLNALRRNY